MAECPTGRYLSEIVTAGGLTLANPTHDPSAKLLDWSASEFKFADWNALAVTLLGRLEDSWRRLKTCPGTAAMDTTRYNGFVERLNVVREGYAKIRKPWHHPNSAWGTPGWTWGVSVPDAAWDASDDIGAITGVIVDAQCLRQRIDEAIVEMGCDVDTPSDTGHKPPPESLGILGKIALATAAIGVVGGTYFIVRRVTR